MTSETNSKQALKQVKVYGERNSGTVYLEWLIKNNLNIRLSEDPDLGWKHRLAPSADELADHCHTTGFICLVKNPYSWLLSMHKRPYQHEELKRLKFSDFIRYSYGDYRNPAVMWNEKNRSYLNMQHYTDHCMIIRYEDLLDSAEKMIRQIADSFFISPAGTFKDFRNRLSNTRGELPERFPADFYRDEKWKKHLKPKHMQAINEFLDKQLMTTLNYNIL